MWWNSSWAISNPKRWCFKALHSICLQIWKTQQWPQDWKRSFSLQSQRKAMPKNIQKWSEVDQLCTTLCDPKDCSLRGSSIHGIFQARVLARVAISFSHTITLNSHDSKIMHKILQARLQQYVTENFQMYKLDLEKAKEPEIKLPTSAGSWKKQENSRKTYTSASLTTLKHLTVWITKNCEKFWNRWEYQNTTLPASYKTCMQVKKQQLEPDMEQWAGSKLGKDYIKALDCHSI